MIRVAIRTRRGLNGGVIGSSPPRPVSSPPSCPPTSPGRICAAQKQEFRVYRRRCQGRLTTKRCPILADEGFPWTPCGIICGCGATNREATTGVLVFLNLTHNADRSGPLSGYPKSHHGCLWGAPRATLRAARNCHAPTLPRGVVHRWGLLVYSQRRVPRSRRGHGSCCGVSECDRSDDGRLLP